MINKLGYLIARARTAFRPRCRSVRRDAADVLGGDQEICSFAAARASSFTPQGERELDWTRRIVADLSDAGRLRKRAAVRVAMHASICRLTLDDAPRSGNAFWSCRRRGPKRADILRQHALYVADLAWSDMIPEDAEHRAYRILGGDWRRLPEVRVDPREELFARANLFRLSGRVPRFIVDAADEHRELSAKLCGLVDRQAIAETMQHRAQCLIRSVPIGTQELRDLLEPSVGLVERFVENIETGGAHNGAFSA
jgi:hypothetical protein